MSKLKEFNKLTSKLTESQRQELYKNARSKEYYQDIWQSVGKCVFCDLKDKYILLEENNVVLTINLYPYIDGQMMAIPKRHVSSLKDLSQAEWQTMRKFSYIAKKLIKKVHKHKAMWNLIREGGDIAQMTVSDHLHMQLIPFDNKDLASWNFRKLKYTPLENVQKYKDSIDELSLAFEKFDRKYTQSHQKDIVVDLLIFNNSKVLLQERKKEFKFSPDIYTLPGGHVLHTDKSLLDALKREVKEEINYTIVENDVELANSELSTLKQNLVLDKNTKVNKTFSFVWNTYLLKCFDNTQEIIPNDDCKKIHWIDLKDVKNNPRISPNLKKVILKTAIKVYSK